MPARKNRTGKYAMSASSKICPSNLTTADRNAIDQIVEYEKAFPHGNHYIASNDREAAERLVRFGLLEESGQQNHFHVTAKLRELLGWPPSDDGHLDTLQPLSEDTLLDRFLQRERRFPLHPHWVGPTNVAPARRLVARGFLQEHPAHSSVASPGAFFRLTDRCREQGWFLEGHALSART